MVASMPLYGKLGDLYGRRRVLLGAIGIFLVGSVACGAAQTMDQLLVARFVQGLGGGGLGAVAMATIADIVPARELGRWLGYQGVIFAVASARRPDRRRPVRRPPQLAVGVPHQPPGRRCVAIAIVATRLRLPDRRDRARARPGRARRCSPPALALFVLLATLGGHDLPWGSAGTIALAAAAWSCSAVAVRAPRAPGPEPVLPLRLFADPVMRASAGINFTSGLLLWCGLFFVPLFVQEVLGVSATGSGRGARAADVRRGRRHAGHGPAGGPHGPLPRLADHRLGAHDGRPMALLAHARPRARRCVGGRADRRSCSAPAPAS